MPLIDGKYAIGVNSECRLYGAHNLRQSFTSVCLGQDVSVEQLIMQPDFKIER